MKLHFPGLENNKSCVSQVWKIMQQYFPIYNVSGLSICAFWFETLVLQRGNLLNFVIGILSLIPICPIVYIILLLLFWSPPLPLRKIRSHFFCGNISIDVLISLLWNCMNYVNDLLLSIPLPFMQIIIFFKYLSVTSFFIIVL